MIPFAIASAYLYENNNMDQNLSTDALSDQQFSVQELSIQELSIQELSIEAFEFRMAKELDLEAVRKIELHFYHGDKNQYKYLELTSFEMRCIKKTEVYWQYQVTTKQEDYRQEVNHLWQEYGQYISLKQAGDDQYLSKELVGYPAELDEKLAANFSSQRAGWMASASDSFCEKWQGMWQEKQSRISQQYSHLEWAIHLDNTDWYHEFLNNSKADFIRSYFQKNGLAKHPIAEQNYTRLYIGNEFCHMLFPNEEELFSLLEKGKAEGLHITLCFSYMQQSMVGVYESLLQKIYRWCMENEMPIEVVINDWGMFTLLKEAKEGCLQNQENGKSSPNFLQPSLGILLNKRRKDPRLSYQRDYRKMESRDKQKCAKDLSENGVYAPFYQEYLQEKYGVTSYEWEAVGGMINSGNHLHIPFYQTNTSQYCTLYARCKNGNRGMQEPVTQCPGYCKEYCFLYPEHLQMVGRYNSLFGYEASPLENPEYLALQQTIGIDRVVVNLM